MRFSVSLRVRLLYTSSLEGLHKSLRQCRVRLPLAYTICNSGEVAGVFVVVRLAKRMLLKRPEQKRRVVVRNIAQCSSQLEQPLMTASNARLSSSSLKVSRDDVTVADSIEEQAPLAPSLAPSCLCSLRP